jgi:hypothetical protein
MKRIDAITGDWGVSGERVRPLSAAEFKVRRADRFSPVQM